MALMAVTSAFVTEVEDVVRRTYLVVLLETLSSFQLEFWEEVEAQTWVVLVVALLATF